MKLRILQPERLIALIFLMAVNATVSAATVAPALMQSAEQDGQVRVIVGLATDSPSIDTAERDQLARRLGNTNGLGRKAAGIKLAGDQLMRKIDPAGAKKARRFKHFPMVAMAVDANEIRRLANSPETAWIAEDRIHKPSLAQSVPLVEANLAHTQGFTGAGQTIAVLDTGVDASHPFLAPRVVAEGCFSSNSSDTTSVCPNGQQSQTGAGAAAPCSPSGCSHGTHVAGISAGNGPSFTGVAPGANVIGVQVFSQFNSSSSCLPDPAPCISAFTSDIIAGLEFVLSQANSLNIAAVNMSLGGGSFTSFCDSDPTKVAIDALRAAGIATIVASGNEGQTNAISGPACISTSVSVGSTTKQDTVSSFSNSASFLTLLAPGGSINSSVTGTGFSVFSGTSMATPHVAGAFAVLRSANPTASVDELIGALIGTGLPITDSRNQITKPRIRIAQAIAAQGGGGDADLQVQPVGGFSASGEPFGPFAPTSQVYTLSNNGSESLDFTVLNSEPWLAVNPTAGTLAPGASAAVTVSIAPAATQLFPGTYTTSLLFDNTTGIGVDSLRVATLTVQGAGAINDKFDNAILLTNPSGSTIGTNVGAEKDSGEPNHGNNVGGASIWWQWVATANGTLTVDTQGSSFDTTLGVYTGASVSTLSSRAQNDDSATTLQSRVEFEATVGTNYLIAVDGFGVNNAVSTGNVALNWQFAEEGATTGQLAVSPAAEFLSTGSLGGPFTPSSMTYTITNTSAAPVGFDVITNGTFFDIDRTEGQLEPGASTTLTVSLNSDAQNLGPGTAVGSVIINGISRTVAVSVLTNSDLQDSFADRIVINDALPAQLLSSNADTTKEPGEPNHGGNSGGASVWWSYTAPTSGTLVIETTGSNFDTLLGVYQGNSLGALQFIAGNDDNSGLQSLVAFEATANETYAIAVDGFASDTGSITLSLDILSGNVPGDNFQDAVEITGQLSLNNTITATGEAGEPLHVGIGNTKSVWWRWRASGGEQVTINTFGSNYDTILAVYTGTSLASLSQVAANDDFNSLQSQVSFTAAPDTTYFVAVDGFSGASGSVQLNIDGANIVERLVSSTLPTSRSVRVGDSATVFATLINNSPDTATGCAVEPGVELPMTFDYQATNPTNNQPVAGTENVPMTLEAFAVQTLLLTFTPSQPIGSVNVPLLFVCNGTSPSQIIPGLNTVLLSASNTVVADVVALAATEGNNGVVVAGPGDPGAFAVATANVGVTEVIEVRPIVSFASPALSLNVCETNPNTGQCLSPPTASVLSNVSDNGTPTFSVFINATGAIPFMPDQNRIAVIFSDPTGNVRGATSVAVSSTVP